jgi:hypothetical protein
MNLVFLYGPPGVGKLTVGQALADITGYRLFHNHLAIDCARPVFEFGTGPFWGLVQDLRVLTIDHAARQDVRSDHHVRI